MKLTVDPAMMPAMPCPTGGRYDGSDDADEADLDVCPAPNDLSDDDRFPSPNPDPDPAPGVHEST